ncbi:MAG: radical SAM protein [Crenarchaeota archaeon]|nr:radical SAM protein [Thermoproteota archaeon]
MREALEFVIKPSNYVSALCYSIFRLEPFTTCSFGCVYCYARWYRGPHGRPRPKWETVRAFEKIAKKYNDFFFRLATLSDPFQEPYGITLKLLEVAKKYEVPIIINTKSDAVVKPDVLPLLKSLASRSLVLVQLSASTLSYSKVLEPGAPDVRRRLGAVGVLASEGVPVVVRVQPLFPGLEEEHLRVAEEALSRGALGLIGESFRGTRRDIELIYKLLGMRIPDRWEPYQLNVVEGKEPLFHPPKEWRERMHYSLATLASRYGKHYSECKDSCTFYGLGRDCCMFWKVSSVHKLRYTLRELLAGIPCKEPYACDGPPPLGKFLRMHHRKVQKLKDEHLEKLCGVEFHPPLHI